MQQFSRLFPRWPFTPPSTARRLLSKRRETSSVDIPTFQPTSRSPMSSFYINNAEATWHKWRGMTDKTWLVEVGGTAKKFSLTKKNNKKPPSIFSFFLNATTTSSLSWRLLQHSLALLFARLLASYPMNSCRARGRNVCDYNKTHPCVCVGVLSICFNRFDTNRIQVFFYLFFPR